FDLEVLPHQRRIGGVRNGARHCPLGDSKRHRACKPTTRARRLLSCAAMLALVLTGILVTTQNGTEIARESWRDDGTVGPSEGRGRGKKARISMDRKNRRLKIDQTGQAAVDVAIPTGSAALMNLHWAAYPVLAEWYKTASTPTPFKAVLGPDRTIDAMVTVKP